VILIARSDEHVLGWYLARSENSKSWEALISRIAPPEVVVSDGGNGFEKARKRVWKDTKVQRCTFHVFGQIKRYTTQRPNLAAGVELYGLACELLHIKDLKSADLWVGRYIKWCTDWEDFLNEKTYDDKNNWQWTHDV
jgi:transposase-like protein